ncbi:MAG: hypothetical protein COT74_05050 [Bdellovibrionales bacterium CG10_big_fil_rev_8_21_14_0_10_45_34]|nr:MAG: hypothetical protein COT74_05050 [Bdellovibrionales bacterium CG10_big_fil_rev_8_21_14_0_10_45_34]
MNAKSIDMMSLGDSGDVLNEVKAHLYQQVELISERVRPLGDIEATIEEFEGRGGRTAYRTRFVLNSEMGVIHVKGAGYHPFNSIRRATDRLDQVALALSEGNQGADSHRDALVKAIANSEFLH